MIELLWSQLIQATTMRGPMVLTVVFLSVGCETRNDVPSASSADERLEAFQLEPWLNRLKVGSTADVAVVHADRESLDLGGTDITDADLRHLSGLERLLSLDISSTYLSDQAVTELLSLTSLKELDIVFTQITGAGIRQLGSHPSLESIDVWHDQLDDDGLAGLARMPSLKRVNLWIPDWDDPEDLVLQIELAIPDVEIEVWYYVPPLDSSSHLETG